MVIYADTSFLFSLYAQDANSPRATELASTLDGGFIVTPLQRFELRNALRLSVFRHEITEDQCQQLLGLIETDIKTGALVEAAVAWAEVYAEGEGLSAAHTVTAGTRALDVLHVACAATLGAHAFYTFDARQNKLAAKAGMTVKP